MNPLISLISILLTVQYVQVIGQTLQINDQEYFEKQGLNVMVYHDYYPVGHQSGVSIIQNGVRVAANGDIRLSPIQRPFPGHGERIVNKAENEIKVDVFYNDELRNKYTDLRYPYPEINMNGTVKVTGEAEGIRVTVDLDEPLPAEWAGKIGFSMELFPGMVFNQPYYMDGAPGTFPRQFNGPIKYDQDGKLIPDALAQGKKLTVLPDAPDDMITFESLGEDLELIDGRSLRNQDWFIIWSPLQTGKTKNVAEWVIKPSIKENYKYQPVIQVSQVGYRSNQEKVAVIELDKNEDQLKEISLLRVSENGGYETAKTVTPTKWGKFLRYNYSQFDFSEITTPGMYKIQYDDVVSHAFMISEDIYQRHVWQPTLEYYLPAQMCHMRVNDRYKVWHGLCHEDDALMAPVSHIHFDGYKQGASTLTNFEPYDPVPGLNVGGWHDAGDYDLRVESQATTTRMLAYSWELFRPEYDETTIDQKQKIVEIHRPDGQQDILQQIEHGALTILGGYKALGRLYRGIICQTGRQYSLLGDGSTMTDNLFYDDSLGENERTATGSGKNDDRLVFTEENPKRELQVAAALATTYRSLKGFNDELAEDCLKAAKELWDTHAQSNHIGLIDAASEIYICTEDSSYLKYIINKKDQIIENIESVAPAIARISSYVDDKQFNKDIRTALQAYANQVNEQVSETPYGVQYTPKVWGAGWGIQRFGVNQYFLHRGFPDIFSPDPVFNSVNFVLGVHPGINTASFVSGVGAKSLLVAYGTNRDDWSYIPGGSASGTALIRPDLPELKEWPYLWQQTEYVMGGGAMNYMFLVLATEDILSKSN